MKNSKDDSFASRRNAASDAKAALLQAHCAARESAEPTRAERQKERLAVSSARTERQAERARDKLEEQKQAQASADRVRHDAEAASRAHIETQEALDRDGEARAAQKGADDKSRRDERYANRKSRQR